MSKALYPLKMPRSIKAAAARLAKEVGVSLDQFIAVAVAEKVGGDGDGCRASEGPRRQSKACGPREVPPAGSPLQADGR